jgi:hypothetical protein
MHGLFSLLKIKFLYMFRPLLVHPQEALHKRHKLQSWHSQLTLYARNILSAVCAVPPEDEQVMLETCIGPWISINCMKSVSRLFHHTDGAECSWLEAVPQIVKKYQEFYGTWSFITMFIQPTTVLMLISVCNIMGIKVRKWHFRTFVLFRIRIPH